MKNLTLLGLLVLSTLASAQNTSTAPEAATDPTATGTAAQVSPATDATPAPEVTETTEAEVRKVDASAGKVTLRHGEIKNLGMPPMTMVFQVKDRAFLTKLKAGDRVNFTADKIKGAYTVLSIEVIQ